MIKIFIILMFSFLFGFGFWYLIFWFITAQYNLFLWHWATKIIYVLLSITSTSGIVESTTNIDK